MDLWAALWLRGRPRSAAKLGGDLGQFAQKLEGDLGVIVPTICGCERRNYISAALFEFRGCLSWRLNPLVPLNISVPPQFDYGGNVREV